MSGDPHLAAMRATLRLAMHALRGGVAAMDAPGGPRRRPAVERDGIELEPADVRRFLAATGGAGLLRSGGGALPPTCCALWETGLALELLAQAAARVPVRGLIHLETELVVARALRAGDVLRCRMELERQAPHPRGTVLELKSRCWSGPGQLCQENTLSILALGPGTAGDPAPRAPAEPAEWRPVAEWGVSAVDAWRYARASGDFNPIHLWSWTARLAGLRSRVLHGSCASSLAAHALVERLMGGDPAALRRLRVRFRAPVALPSQLRLLVAPGEGTAGRFRVVDAREEARRPFLEGEFAGAPAR